MEKPIFWKRFSDHSSEKELGCLEVVPRFHIEKTLKSAVLSLQHEFRNPRIQESRTRQFLYVLWLNLMMDLYGPEPGPKPGIQDSGISISSLVSAQDVSIIGF